MPHDAPRASGPWGPALEHWLRERRLSQAELLRRINAARLEAAKGQRAGLTQAPEPNVGSGAAGGRATQGADAKQMGPNTISRIVRGYHTQTQLLAEIAQELAVPLEDVLVSPTHRRIINDDQDELLQRMHHLQLLLERTQRYLAEATRRPQSDPATLDLAKRLQALPAKLRRNVQQLLADYERRTKPKRRSRKKPSIR